MTDVKLGDRVTVVTPNGEVQDTVTEIVEPPTELGVTTVRCKHCGLTVVWAGLDINYKAKGGSRHQCVLHVVRNAADYGRNDQRRIPAIGR